MQIDELVRVFSSSSRKHHEPYDHLHYSVLDQSKAVDQARQIVRQLIASYPHSLLEETSRVSGSDKSYTVCTLPVVENSEHTESFASLPHRWQELIRALTAPESISTLADTLGFDVAKLRTLEVRFAAYNGGGWMSRHTDGPDKLFSWVLYFNEQWDPKWGGAIQFFRSRDAVDPTCSMPPGPMSAAAFARSDASWHEVAGVADQAPEPRRTLLVHGYR